MQELSPKQVEAFLAKRQKKTSKYKARRTKLDGIWFDSRAEAARYVILMQMLKRNEIRKLKLHPRFKLTDRHSYVADFSYDVIHREAVPDSHVIEDCKGFRTAVYKLKKQMMKELYGIDILETTVPASSVDALLLGYLGQSCK